MQAEEILRALGLTCGFDAWLALPANGATTTVTVGVAGHRALTADPALADTVRATLAAIRTARVGGGRLAIRGQLAEGADQLVAGIAAEQGDALHAVLPMTAAAYRREFTSPEALADFGRLLARADVLEFPFTARGGDAAARAQAYARCGRAVVDHSDVLLALWDGAPSQGPGGTAEIVAHARQVGCPVYWIATRPPYAVSAPE